MAAMVSMIGERGSFGRKNAVSLQSDETRIGATNLNIAAKTLGAAIRAEERNKMTLYEVDPRS